MATIMRIDQQTVAEQNRYATLKLLQKHGPLSRRQLAQLTGLRNSTLTYVTREFMERGVLRSAGKRASKRAGQKEILLEIDPRFGYTVGFDLRLRSARMVIRDVAGQLIETADVVTDVPLDRLPMLLRDGLEQRLTASGQFRGRLLGIAVGVPGVVDVARGKVLNSIPLDLQNFPLREHLAVAFDAPILVDHNVNLAAFAEAREGAASHCSDFVYLLINPDATRARSVFTAFGAALFLKGELHRGVHFGAGELDQNIAPRLNVSLEADDMTQLESEEGPLTPTLQALAEAAARCIASIVNLLDPHAAILGSSRRLANRRFLQAVEQAVNAALIPIQHRLVTVRGSALGQQAVALGGALAILDRQFEGMLCVKASP